MLKICLVSAELAPFSKTGGLGDVTGALAGVLHRAGCEVRVFSPFYGSVRTEGRTFEPEEGLQGIPLGPGSSRGTCSVSTVLLPGSAPPGGADLAVHLVRCPELYDRPGIYTGDPDEPLRFAALCRAAVESCRRRSWGPDVFHVHDWHTALLPLYLKTIYSRERLFAATRTVLTLHNIGYQGVFSSDLLGELGLAGESHHLAGEDLAAGRLNLLKTGILHADRLTTVSRTHALEIQTPEGGFGLDGLLRARSAHLTGIVNGIDERVWNPATDPLIPYPFSADSLTGKTKNKRALLEDLGLSWVEGVPLVGIVSRLTHQKGFDLAAGPLPQLLAQKDLRLVVLGTGESQIEGFFRSLEADFPAGVRFRCAHDEELAHRIEAAADLFLMPSRYEPCGLNQMYSQVYGTIPVVHRTGGLADTVQPWNPQTGEGTGFVFEHPDEEGLRWALGEALATWRRRDPWRRLQRNAMTQDFSWERQGRLYLELYRELVGGG